MIGPALGLAAGLVGLTLSATATGRQVEDLSYDRRLRATARQSDARPDIALVLINDSSLQALEPAFGGWPWPRLLHAGVIDFLARAGARVIGYDVLFLEHDRRTLFDAGGRQMSGAESDAALVEAVRRSGRVVLLADAVYEGLEQETAAKRPEPGALTMVYRPGAGFPERANFRLPFPELAAAALAVGHNYGRKGTGGVPRDMWPFVEWNGVGVPSLGLAAAIASARTDPREVALDGRRLRIGVAEMPLRDDLSAVINFHGPFRAGETFTYPAYSFFDVLLSEDRLESGQPPAIDPSVFRDKIVLVGTSAAGLADIWPTSFGDASMPGVLLHAALADDVLSRRFMRRADVASDRVTTVAAGIIAGVVATAVPVVWAVPIVVVGAIGFVLWLTRELGSGVWYAVVAPLFAVAAATFEGVAWQYFVEGREKRRIKGLFGRYVSKDVFDLLIADPSVARLGGARREMTVLFSDIRGFTSASERGAPEAIVQQLNEYFTAMVDVLFRHQGTLDKFVGDMVMGLFGAPVADPRHADHAVAAALEMSTVLDGLNARWAAEGRAPLEIGVGINSGEMIAGNIGSETIMSYTVIGDAVNLGARLESLNKEYGTRILISDETRRRLTTPVVTRLVGAVTVKGRTQPVTVYEVTGSAS